MCRRAVSTASVDDSFKNLGCEGGERGKLKGEVRQKYGIKDRVLFRLGTLLRMSVDKRLTTRAREHSDWRGLPGGVWEGACTRSAMGRSTPLPSHGSSGEAE